MEIHRDVIIEHVKKTNEDYHIYLIGYELHKSRDSILCAVYRCKKGEYVFDTEIIRIMYTDYNLTLRKRKINKYLNG